ncbi:MAG: M23/M56 family metallopeptidase [Rhodanobacteraceae bacterium]
MMTQILLELAACIALSLPVMGLARTRLFRPGHAQDGLFLVRALFVGLALLPWLAHALGASGWLASAEASAPIALELHGLVPGLMATDPGASAESMKAGLTAGSALLAVWLLGVTLLLLPFAQQRLKYRKLARHAVGVDPRRFGLSLPAKTRLAATAAPVAPFVAGLRHPRIIVPLHYFDGDSGPLRAVLQHECAHIRNRDMFWLPLCRTLLFLSWPILPLWFLYRDLGFQTELAADELALLHADMSKRRDYAGALLDALGRHAEPVSAALPGFLSLEKRRVRMRISNAMKPVDRKSTHTGRMVTLLMAATLLVPAVWIQGAVAGGNVKVNFVSPMHTGHISSRFGDRKNPFNGKLMHHAGIDIAAKAGTPILAPADGKVVFAGWKDDAHGNVIEIRHGKAFSSVYVHLQTTAVKAGDTVKAGALIGKVGETGKSTGPHLHLELYHDGVQLDPAKYLPLDLKSNRTS